MPEARPDHLHTGKRRGAPPRQGRPSTTLRLLGGGLPDELLVNRGRCAAARAGGAEPFSLMALGIQVVEVYGLEGRLNGRLTIAGPGAIFAHAYLVIGPDINPAVPAVADPRAEI